MALSQPEYSADVSEAREGGETSVVLITRNRADELCAAVATLLELPDELEVIVIDNGSTDASVERVRRQHPRARTVSLEGNFGSAARNLGVALANNEVVAFCDDDSFWTPGALTTARELLMQNPDIGLLAGRVLLGSGRVDDPVNEQLESSPLGRSAGRPGPDVLGFIACAGIVRRRAFLEAGGFDAMLGIGGEETLLSLRLAAAGWACVYVSELVALHTPSAVRDRAERDALIVRNRLWTEWLARPWPAATAATIGVIRQSASDDVARRGLLAAARGWRSVLSRRCAVPDRVASSWARVH
jgi:GT2 family glycosyltransferase